ncbi:hypothetical protein DW651_02670 [Subdoligranulum sp. AM23-21AC]|nr:hypothetical protein DW651_02670 [Subdoligranulum sp. AM23-21AC]
MAGAPIQAHRRLLIAYHKTRGKAALFCKFAPRPGAGRAKGRDKTRKASQTRAPREKYACFLPRAMV